MAHIGRQPRQEGSDIKTGMVPLEKALHGKTVTKAPQTEAAPVVLGRSAMSTTDAKAVPRLPLRSRRPTVETNRLSSLRLSKSRFRVSTYEQRASAVVPSIGMVLDRPFFEFLTISRESLTSRSVVSSRIASPTRSPVAHNRPTTVSIVAA